MKSQTKCPHCRLPMTLSYDPSGNPQLFYDTDEWRRRCKRLDLGSPAFCLVEPPADPNS
jgi:hypothetical protein